MQNFSLKIEGHHVTPESVRLTDLFEVLRALEASIAITARGYLDSSEPVDLHLTGVGPGSAACTLAISPAGYQAAVLCATAIADRDLSPLPEKAREPIFDIWKKSKARNWTIRVFDGNGMPSAEISPATTFTTDSEIQGRTTIAATVIRVGGTPKPTAQIALLDGTKMYVSIANEKLAATLGTMLYHTVSLEGEAKWLASNWKLIDFRATGIGAYDDSADVMKSLERLAGVSDGFWDEVDPDEYIAALRSE